MSRRSLLGLIGLTAGSAVMYEAMTAMAFAGESGFTGPIQLPGDPKGASVLILGAGMAGMAAAYELRKAGYKVQILEYNGRPGGRNWSLYGGDEYTEMGGFKQKVEFDKGLYLNPGPWRLPYHHQAILHYCRVLNVALEPFTQVNYNAFIHSSQAFGGKPQRYRHVQADFQGHVAELLAKTMQQERLDQPVTREDREMLLAAMREWGSLDKNYGYVKGVGSSERRGWLSDPGGGVDSVGVPSDPLAMRELMTSGMWGSIAAGQMYEFQSVIFQPIGGMGMIGKAFGRELGDVIHYNAKVIDIHQDDRGVTATYVDARAPEGPKQTARADWCVNTIPAMVLAQIPMNVGPKLADAIDALWYESAVKVGLQFKRRFWEEDEHIYGGISYTDLPNSLIGYPSTGYFTQKGVLLGAYTFGPHAFEYTAMDPQERVAKTVEYGAQIHPQYRDEFETGVSVAWHRVPGIMGCTTHWTEALREQHYDNLCAIDGRIVLAGEHVSRLPGWQEGSLLSSLDAIKRLHQRVLAA